MADALTSMATVQALAWQWEAAEASFCKATESRSHAAAGRQFSMLLTALGRFDEACQQIENAQRIDPFCNLQKSTYARFLYQSRRYEEAIEVLTEPLRFGPLPLPAQLYLGFIYAGMGNNKLALQMAQQAHRCVGAQANVWSWTAEIYARAGDLATAQSICNQYALLSPEAEVSRYRQARLAVALGSHAEALALLSASYAQEEPELSFLNVEPGFDAVRTAPEFAALVEKIGFPRRYHSDWYGRRACGFFYWGCCGPQELEIKFRGRPTSREKRARYGAPTNF